METEIERGIGKGIEIATERGTETGEERDLRGIATGRGREEAMMATRGGTEGGPTEEREGTGPETDLGAGREEITEGEDNFNLFTFIKLHFHSSTDYMKL